MSAAAATIAPLANAAIDSGVEEYEKGEGDDAQDDEAAPVVVARVDVVHAHGRDGDEGPRLKAREVNVIRNRRPDATTTLPSGALCSDYCAQGLRCYSLLYQITK